MADRIDENDTPATGLAEDAPGAPEAQDPTPPDVAPETPAEPPVEPPVGEPTEPEPDEEADGEAEALAAEPAPEVAPEPEPEPEPEGPRFGAQFSSPEPTTVTARPRRRATRPALPADPDSVAPPAAAPFSAPLAAPFVPTFVAPEPEVAAPRRRSRRPVAESPVPADDVVEETPLDEQDAPAPRRSRSRRRPAADAPAVEPEADELTEDRDADEQDDRDDRDGDDASGSGSRRRRRGRRGRGRGRAGDEGDDESGDATAEDAEDGAADEAPDERAEEPDTDSADADEDDDEQGEAGSGSSTRRRRRRRRRGTGEAGADDSSTTTDDDDRPERAGRTGRTSSDDDVRGVAGSTRLEAKRQRRREGRSDGRRRAPILSESEFLARREAVDRAMVIRQQGERTQIAVLEDDVLVEHYVTQAQSQSFAGNVYLGRVQNVLPSMEAAFVDIGKGRNAVLYAGEVNWDAAGLSGKQRSIETALKSGDKVLVQVTKDPIGHKGARLTQQVNLPGRFLVYVPGGSMTGISRKLPDKERTRLKDILKKIVPDDAGVIIRTAAEGASEEELTRDVARLQAQWEVIQTKASSTSSAPTLLYGEPDLAIRVIRDVFNEDFKRLVVQGDDAWDTVEAYVAHVSPELSERLQRYTGTGDVFRDLRIDEQLAKALDRKVWLPSGGSLVIDRTEAMTVIDVNTGKFTGSGGNLEQTVTRNNIEAAEEIVRQLRLRDIGGIIVIDFIDMVLESNRDLVLRRLTECLGRDRTKHQVAEVTSLGLVQMTRKRVGQGLLEVFSEPCEHCRGRGIVVHTEPVDDKRKGNGGNGGGHSHGNGGNGGGSGSGGGRNRDQQRSGVKDAEPVVAETAAPAEAAPEGAEGEAATEGTGSGRSGRRRGRRGRGQSGEARAAEDAAALDGGRDDEGTDDEPADDEVTAVADEVAPTGQPVAEETVTGEPTAEGTVTTVDEDGETAEPAAASPEAALAALAAGTAPVVEEAEPVAAAVDEDGEAAPVADTVTAAPTDLAVPEDLAVPADLAVPEAPAVLVPEEPAVPVAEAQPAAEPAAVVARPRRRRAASRPAGPPA